MSKKKSTGSASKAKEEPKKEEKTEVIDSTNTESIPVEPEPDIKEPVQPVGIETPDIIEKETIIVSEPPVANVKINLPQEVIQKNEKKGELVNPVQSKGSGYETTDYRKLKKVTGKKRNRFGVIYVGVKR